MTSPPNKRDFLLLFVSSNMKDRSLSFALKTGYISSIVLVVWHFNFCGASEKRWPKGDQPGEGSAEELLILLG